MSSTFTILKQQAFGSLIGSMFATIKREHNLTDEELAQVALTIAAARAVEAHWAPRTFAARAQQSFDTLQAQLGRVTHNVDKPIPLIGPNGRPLTRG